MTLHIPITSRPMHSDGASKLPSQNRDVYVNAGKDACIRLHADVDLKHQKIQVKLITWQTARATQDQDYHSTPRRKPGHDTQLFVRSSPALPSPQLTPYFHCSHILLFNVVTQTHRYSPHFDAYGLLETCASAGSMPMSCATTITRLRMGNDQGDTAKTTKRQTAEMTW